jgi:uncharacterized protein
MALSPELLAAYRTAHYVVRSPQIVIRIGEPNRALDELMGEANTAAFITAANPKSEARSAEDNEFLLAALHTYVEAAGYAFVAGEGRDPKGEWPSEPSVLILGIARGEAVKLGRAFQQNAIVFCERGKAPELVLVAKLKLVLDTQVWLDWLVFDDAAIAPLRAALAEERAEIYIDAACEAKLERALGYRVGKKVPDKWLQDARLGEARRVAKSWPVRLTDEERAALPRCSDADDQKFLELALAANADALVTRDAALLSIGRRAPFRILRPTAFESLSSGAQ